MVSRTFVLLSLLLALVACGAAPESAAPTTAPAVPTAAPTMVSLADLDLEPLLVQAGDLPAGMSGAQVRDTAPKMFDGMPTAERTAYEQFAQGGKQTGGVTVFLYERAAERDMAYQFILKGMGETAPAAGIGEKALVTKPDPNVTAAGLTFFDVLFQRCRAVVHVRMTGAGLDQETVAAYAKRLDKRLQSAVC